MSIGLGSGGLYGVLVLVQPLIQRDSFDRSGLLRSWWMPAVVTAGLSGLKFHELRHTFVALWIAAGANPKEVSVRAGHSSVAFTLDRYGHLYEDLQDETPDRLDTLLTGHLASHTRPKELPQESGKGEPRR